MKTSQNIEHVSAAIVAAQAELKNAVFDKTNPHFKSKYATLSSVRDSVTPVLAKHGLAVIQGTDRLDDGSYAVTSRMVHTSGQWLESSYPLAIDKPQAMGSALTYARRYLLSSMCGIASEEDDDANGTNSQTAKVEPQASKVEKIDHEANANELVRVINLCTSGDELQRLIDSQRFKDETATMPEVHYEKIKSAYKQKKAALLPKAA